MPRGPRIHLAGDVVHVVTRGVNHEAIFVDDGDRRDFLARLERTARRFHWRCLTYCLMGNHYHLVVELDEPMLSAGVQALNGGHGRLFNRRHGRSGHLFEGRFWSRTVQTDEHFYGLARYVALNPVRAGLCAAAATWPWSAHSALIGQSAPGLVDVDRMLSHFGAEPMHARAAYEAIVAGETPADQMSIDSHLGELLAYCDRDDAVAAGRKAGFPAGQIADTLGCEPQTIIASVLRREAVAA
jgi:REP element-mobilizing transposase RayT